MGVKCPKCQYENPDDTIFCGKCATPIKSAEEISITKTLITPTERLQKGSTIAGKYKILEELGRGGMGVVYKAEDTRLDRNVALKFLPPELTLDTDARNRFIQEAKAASGLDHPNICTVHEIDETEDGQVFISMPCYEGESLKQKISQGLLKQEEALNIAIQVVKGLAKAHKQGIVHRDIKPANIMVTSDSIVKIVDFGLAKLSGHIRLTRTGATMGTVAYMSPEQAQGEAVDYRSDIWSLGVVLYEMISSHLPFKGENEQAFLYSIINKDPLPLVDLCNGAPVEFEQIINKCLMKNPNKRYLSILELRAALELVQQQIGSGRALLPSSPKFHRQIFSRFFFKFALPIGAVTIMLALLLLWSLSDRTVKKWLGFEPLPREKSLTVLPFTVVGHRSASQAYSDGLVEIITRKLTQLECYHKSFWIVPSNEVRAAKITNPSEVSQVMGVNLAVSGSIQYVGGMIRLTLNLMDTNSLRTWNSPRTLTDPITNLSTWQNDAAKEIAQMLEIKLEPDMQRALTTGDTVLPEAFEYYIKGLGLMQPPHREENLNNAIHWLNRALEQDAQYAAAYARLGEAYWYQYQHKKNSDWIEKALLSCNRAIQIDSNLLQAYITRGVIYRKTGRFDDAIRVFQQALQLEPQYYDAQIELATTYEEAERLIEAETSYKKAIKLRPSYWTAFSYLGYFYWRFGRLSEAENIYRKITGLMPENITGYNNLGALYIQSGKNEQAMAVLEKSISIKPSEQACSNLGALYFYQRRYADSVAMLEEAANLAEDNHLIWGNLADAYRFTLGSKEKTRAAYQRAIKLAKEQLAINQYDTHLRSSLAYYYAASGDHKKAIDEISKAQELTPNDISVLQKCIQIFELTNQREQALQALELYLKNGGAIEEVLVDPDLSRLHSDPRFRKLKTK